MARLHIGTAGWGIPGRLASAFPGDGPHLHRYAQHMGCAEINSSFHRPHRFEVYQRWADSTPADFRFSVKLPRSITHEGRLRRARAPLGRFMAEVTGLGRRLAVLLVQLPPSFAFEPRPARNFFDLLRAMFDGAVVCEPRHASWFTPAADHLLASQRISRAAADPVGVLAAQQPGGWLGVEGDGLGSLLYHRWHGSPRRYWSSYEHDWLHKRVEELLRWPKGTDRWCIFDNTASGAALANALELRTLLLPHSSDQERQLLLTG